MPYNFLITDDSLSFKDMPPNTTGIPIHPHPGAYGVKRSHHHHEGIDIYCEDKTPIYALEEGIVVAVIPFTGPSAGFPWWHDTQAVLIEDNAGVWVYGEITTNLKPQTKIEQNQLIGYVEKVLKKDKGRPMSMLHLERHKKGTTMCPSWSLNEKAPVTSLDPTERLLNLLNLN